MTRIGTVFTQTLKAPRTTGIAFGMAESHAQMRLHFHALRAAQSDRSYCYGLTAFLTPFPTLFP
ncbi:MAG: hypothetical protein KGM47_07195, partial [Acidobacteriota bacterium]|nr:hypothetical protein [Acidobacteriota bacterium]